MAKRKPSKIVQKTKINKPSSNASNIIKDAVRIRNNEQSKLRRIEKKYESTRNKKEKSKLRLQFLTQQKDVVRIRKDVSQIRSIEKKAKSVSSELKSLRSKNTRLSKSLDSLQENGDYGDKFKKESKEVQKTIGKIQERENELKKQLYKLNKQFGFSSEEAIKALGIKASLARKEMSEDVSEAFIKSLEPPPIEVPELEDDGEYLEEIVDVFWVVWRDFDKNESPKLSTYKKVTFIINGVAESYNGESYSYIHMKAQEMWRVARAKGSLTYAAKYISIDETKLKYVLF
jgi:ATP-dependent Lon protease